MNTCKDLFLLEGCGRCNIKFKNSNLIKQLSSATVVEVIKEILSHQKQYPESIVTADSYITCTGLITIVYADSTLVKSYSANRELCLTIITKWISGNIEQIVDCICILYLLLCGSLIYYNSAEQAICRMLDSFQLLVNFTKGFIKRI
jgi:hypothetical protein